MKLIFKPWACTVFFAFLFTCTNNESCDFVAIYDCNTLQQNVNSLCDSNADGTLNGTLNAFCECVPNSPLIANCPGFIQNGDFENLQPNANPNATVDNDINLALGWKPLWQSGSLADLFNDSTISFGNNCFMAPTPSSGVFAAMWVENNTNANAAPVHREGFFNTLNATITQNSGIYNLTFNYARMSENCSPTNDVKVGVYGVSFDGNLPQNPQAVGVPTNLDLFGIENTVFFGEIVVSSTSDNAWITVNFNIDTTNANYPVNGINHIMITNSHIPLQNFGRMYVGFDDFCLVNDF